MEVYEEREMSKHCVPRLGIKLTIPDSVVVNHFCICWA